MLEVVTYLYYVMCVLRYGTTKQKRLLPFEKQHFTVVVFRILRSDQGMGMKKRKQHTPQKQTKTIQQGNTNKERGASCLQFAA